MNRNEKLIFFCFSNLGKIKKKIAFFSNENKKENENERSCNSGRICYFLNFDFPFLSFTLFLVCECHVCMYGPVRSILIWRWKCWRRVKYLVEGLAIVSLWFCAGFAESFVVVYLILRVVFPNISLINSTTNWGVTIGQSSCRNVVLIYRFGSNETKHETNKKCIDLRHHFSSLYFFNYLA